MDGIFISYRREDSAGYAGRLYDRLVAHFGPGKVFMDVEGIDPGTDFVDAIERAVTSCRVLIVLIGDEWLGIKDGSGRRRIDDPHDFIRIETSVALQRNIRVVPVLLEGTEMPRVDELPEELAALSRRQAITVSHKQWESSTGDLIETLGKLFAQNDTPAIEVKGSPRSPRGAGESRPGGRTPRSRAAVWGAIGLGCAVAAGGWLVWHTIPQPQPSLETSSVSGLTPASPPATLSQLEEKPVGSDMAARITPPAQQPAPPAQAVAADPSVQVEKPTQPATLSPPEIPVHEDKPEPEISVQPEKPVEVAKPEPALPVLPQQPVQPERPVRAEEPAVPEKKPVQTEQSAQPKRTVQPETAPPAAKRLQPQKPSGAIPMNRSGISPKAEAPAPARAPQSVDSAAGRLPAVGDRWTYRIRGLWPTIPVRTIEASILAVDESGVSESLSRVDRDARTLLARHRVPGPAAYIIASREMGTEFSPYLGAFDGLEPGSSWRGIETPDTDSFWTGWHTTGEVKGSEEITVPAGSFMALKVAVESSRGATGSSAERDREPVRVQYTVWYAPQVKRYLKLVRKVISASGQTADLDTFELLGHSQRR